MKKIKDGLIVVVLILLLLLAGNWYLNRGKYSEMENKYKTEILKQDSLIQIYNDSINVLVTKADKLVENINKKDSVIQKQKGSIIYINRKYGELKKEIENANADESVKYLAKRLNDIDTTYKSKTPKLMKMGEDTLCSVDVNQVKMLNKTFISLDEKTEELDTTKSIVKNQESVITDYKELVSNKDETINLKDSIITSNETKVKLGEDEQKRLKVEIRKQKIQKWITAGSGIVIIVLLLL